MQTIRRSVVLLGWVLGLSLAAFVLVRSTGPLVGGLVAARSEPDVAVAVAAAVLAWFVLAWLALGVALGLVEALSRMGTGAGQQRWGRLCATVSPTRVRRAVRTSLRAGLVAGVVTSAVASPAVYAAPGSPAGAVHPDDRVEPTDWPALDRPAQPFVINAPQTAGAATGKVDRSPAQATYRVRAGDSLWSIAADHLPDGASVADVARSWPHWWHSNHDTVGDHPDLIHPGQVLRIPGSSS